MRSPHPAAATPRYHRALAVLFIAAGTLSTSIYLVGYFDPAANRWTANGMIETAIPGPAVSLQPGAAEWPLMTANRIEAISHRPEHYALDVAGIRGTALLKLQITGPSPERTGAFAQWLTEGCAQNLQRSYDRRSILRPAGALQVVGPLGPSVAVHKMVGRFIAGLLTPLLLAASGFLLHRASTKICGQRTQPTGAADGYSEFYKG